VGLRRRCAALVLSPVVLIAVGCGSGSSSNSSTGGQPSSFPPATLPLVKLSTDTFTNSTSQHATEVEPDSFSFGSTIVSAFQIGRISTGGSSDIGFATSTDAGATWQNGFLPGLTTFQGAGVNAAVSDPAVAYDAKHAVWMISSLTIANDVNGTTQVVVSTSPDGLNWSTPVAVSHTPDPDKDWITCDNTATSSFYGHCYIEWDDVAQSALIWMSTSTDGGVTWAPALNSSGGFGLGGQPVVQSSGTVIVPFLGGSLGPDIQTFSSTDGGVNWGATTLVSTISVGQVAGGLRTDPLPSAQIDAADNIYVVWQDCSFRANCSSNDLVMSTSADGITWSPKARIPIDPTTSTVDHFIPGLGIDPTTGGSTAHLGLSYYYYPQANCSPSACALYVGFISSSDGGNTWSAATPIAGPMTLSWLPSTTSGQMVGDYIATSFAGGKAYGVFAVAKVKSGSTFDEAIYTTQSGFDVEAAQAHNSSAGEQPITIVTSTRKARTFSQRIR
jgi:hypothetical protein